MSEETSITFDRTRGVPEDVVENNTPSITIREQIASLLIVFGAVGGLVLGCFAFGWKWAGFGFCIFILLLGLVLAYQPTTPVNPEGGE